MTAQQPATQTIRSRTSIRVLAIGLWLGFLALQAAAQVLPENVAAGIITNLGASLKAEEAALSGDKAIEAAVAIINRDVAPHMDFPGITREAVGKPWESATPVQRAALEREFRQLLVHVLARLLAGNRNDVLEALPTGTAPNAERAVVRVAVTRQRVAGNQAQEPMLVTLRKVGTDWKVHELRTDGVDVVKLYSSNFAVVIERNGGIDGLIRALAERNARNARPAAARPAASARVLAEDACLGCSSP